jgi:hypothetical protein
MSLSTAGFDAAAGLEIARLENKRRDRLASRTRSQYVTTAPPIYDAEQGHAEVRLSGGGLAYAQRITNSALGRRTAVSLPRRSTVGFVDAKPV